MRQTRTIMSMPVVVDLVDPQANQGHFDQVFDYLVYMDETFSVFKKDSEISRINRGELRPEDYSKDMKTVLALSDAMRARTNGYFNSTKKDGTCDPSGLVKGWAIYTASQMLDQSGIADYLVEIAGDLQVRGVSGRGEDWSIGIRNPFRREEIVKVVYPKGAGMATSGSYVHGGHIYDPFTGDPVATSLVSITVIGPTVWEADCFATAAFAMGDSGCQFIEGQDGFEAYAIDASGMATMTSGFERYTRI